MKIKNIFFAIASSLVILAACKSNAQLPALSVADFEKSITQNSIQLLDVRTAGEYQSGHLAHALLADWTNQEEFKKRVKALDKNIPVYTYCLSGARSNAAMTWLNENGFTAYNLKGGINAWKQEGKPLEMAEVVKQITVDEYMAKIVNDKTVLVDFGAVWCPPCKKMAPVLDSLLVTHGSKFILVKIDGGQQTNICKELKIEGFPTFIIYKSGKEIWRKEGIVEEKEFIQLF